MAESTIVVLIAVRSVARNTAVWRPLGQQRGPRVVATGRHNIPRPRCRCRRDCCGGGRLQKAGARCRRKSMSSLGSARPTYLPGAQLWASLSCVSNCGVVDVRGRPIPFRRRLFGLAARRHPLRRRGSWSHALLAPWQPCTEVGQSWRLCIRMTTVTYLHASAAFPC